MPQARYSKLAIIHGCILCDVTWPSSFQPRFSTQRHHYLRSPLRANNPAQIPQRPQKLLSSALNNPAIAVGAAGAQQQLDLFGGAGAQTRDDAVEDEDEGHDGYDVDVEEAHGRPPVQEWRDQEDEKAEEEAGYNTAWGSVLELEYAVWGMGG